jgi:uncharacterized membrane protein
MKLQHTPALAIGIGVVAGLRPMMALAVVAWGLRRRWIRPGRSPYARIVSADVSKRIAEFAISELIADKLPFTRSRLDVAPLASRIASGAICGAAMNGTGQKRQLEGAALGGLGALAGAIAGCCVRQRFNRGMPDFSVALLEDALAVGGGVVAVALAANAE